MATVMAVDRRGALAAGSPVRDVVPALAAGQTPARTVSWGAILQQETGVDPQAAAFRELAASYLRLPA